MAVYVDEAAYSKPPRFINWAHLTADSVDELHAFAQRLGLKRSWFQDKHPTFPHYDVSPSVRAKAITLGAVEVKGKERVAQMVEQARNRNLERGIAGALADHYAATTGLDRASMGEPEQPLLFGGVDAAVAAIHQHYTKGQGDG